MIIRFLVEYEISHVSGKFVSKDELADELEGELESADPGTLQPDESEYSVDAVIVSRYDV